MITFHNLLILWNLEWQQKYTVWHVCRWGSTHVLRHFYYTPLKMRRCSFARCSRQAEAVFLALPFAFSRAPLFVQRHAPLLFLKLNKNCKLLCWQRPASIFPSEGAFCELAQTKVPTRTPRATISINFAQPFNIIKPATEQRTRREIQINEKTVAGSKYIWHDEFYL